MQAMRKAFLTFLLLTSSLTCLQAQDPPFNPNEDYSEAYADSGRATHWSVYIPATVLVVAAIWLAVQDKTQSSGSVEGNGSLATGSRNSGSYSH